MPKIEKIDVKENQILKLSEELLGMLLKDMTTNKNIIWAVDNYKSMGSGYFSNECITISAITGENGEIIKPRTKKLKAEQQERIKTKAEVFTPSWICNTQNNMIDESWFGYKNVFNIEKEKTWKTLKRAIKFPSNKTWKDYVKVIRMEIACGEAPYLVSRYDTVSGEVIEINERIGLLDRKLRIINENVDVYDDWLFWVKEAYRSIYGYEWQGDNLLLARENLLYTFRDNYIYKFDKLSTVDEELEIVDIICWNVWQMDGIKMVIPNSCKSETEVQLTLFGDEEKQECRGCKKCNYKSHNGIYSKTKNWETGRAVKFVNVFDKGRRE